MIKAETEFRIGNIVYNPAVELSVISEVLQNGVFLDEDGMITTYEFIESVKLTPAILEKCGFEERKHLNDWFIKLKDTHTILIILIGFDVANICPSNSKPCLYMHCGYLHQLQNLYYCLVGKELTYLP